MKISQIDVKYRCVSSHLKIINLQKKVLWFLKNVDHDIKSLLVLMNVNYFLLSEVLLNTVSCRQLRKLL